MIDGKKVKYFRTRIGMSRRELSRRTMINPSIISQIENGLYPDPDAETLLLLTKTLFIDVDDILL